MKFRAKIDSGGVLAAVRDIRRMTGDHEIERDVAADAELIFAAHALRDTGRMARSIRAVGDGAGLLIIAEARDPETGYDYVGVTRKGHRRRTITPNRRTRKRGSRAVLRTPYGPRSSVRGFHPAGDWVDQAIPEVQAAAEQRMERLGRKVAARWRLA